MDRSCGRGVLACRRHPPHCVAVAAFGDAANGCFVPDEPRDWPRAPCDLPICRCSRPRRVPDGRWRRIGEADVPSNAARTATVIAVERSARIADVTTLRDSLRAVPATDQMKFLVFDTTARIHDGEDAALTDVSSPVVGGGASLTVGLLTAIREARHLTRDHESVGIVLASTFSRGSFDRATADVRAAWRDSIRVIRIQSSPIAAEPVSVEAQAAGDDPVVAGVRLAQAGGLLLGTSGWFAAS
jgi:hypothetical protein